MRQKMAATARIIIGWALLVFGVLGLALPFLQGVILLIVGMYILSLDSRWFRKKLAELAKKDVRVASAYQKIDRRIRKLFCIRNHNDQI